MPTTTKKMRPKKGAANFKGKGKVRSVQERNDDDIMHTNDSSITSKRCVSKLYFPNEPDFYEPFAPKYMRRNPLINRGYWLRMHAIEQAVVQFLQEDSAKTKVIVNLGCGYDPLPFQFWHRHDSLSKHAVFIDVDYPQLIGRKRDRILTNDILRDALLKTNLHSSQAPVFIRSDQYKALGCDLRDLSTLEDMLKAELDLPNSSILFLAEVSLTYMPVPDSDSLIRWASTLEDARFCLLEQYLPQGTDHPFAQTMLRHFDKLQTPIQAVKKYPALSGQVSRFEHAGWPTIKIARNMWDLWSDDDFTAPAARHRLDTVEPFDEWEEFSLFAGHYFLLVASNSDKEKPMETATVAQSNSDDQGSSGIEAQSMIITHRAATATSQLIARRFGAAFSIGSDMVAFHGGQGLQARLASIDVLQRNDLVSTFQPCDSTTPQARICQTVTPLNSTAALMAGGRASPTHALADCWLIDQGVWQQVHDLNPARFRHSAVKVTIPSEDSDIEGVFVFGGKASDGTVLDECMLWTPAQGWTTMAVDSPQRPSARFGAAISTLGSAQNSGYLVGGIGSAPSGVVLEDMWEWRITAPNLHLEFKDRTNDVRKANASLAYGRLGASLVPFEKSLLLIGGVSKKEIGSLRDDFVTISPDPDRDSIRVEQPRVTLPESAWPLLVGAGVTAVSQDEIVIAGGGAVCFSMGSFWNEGHFTITTNTNTEGQTWRVPKSITNTNSSQAQVPKPPPASSKTKKKANTPTPTPIPRIQLQTAEDFASLLTTSTPAIITGQDIGPCLTLWTLPYLREKIDPSREVVIHKSTSARMTFASKNFQYIKSPFGAFIDDLSASTADSPSYTYLRATSTTQATKQPTSLSEDFPEIAGDFILPDVFREVKENQHSSPLRISGPVALWLHYDVLANILCQIRGKKTLQLYPPSDVKHLSYPPGGSSSNIDVHDPTPRDAWLLRHTHPRIATLEPGDILFIPPMWSHTAQPEDGTSVAVNVFFRNLEAARYAAGKDVYGNRDLQAYENGRRDVEKIKRAFKNVPGDLAGFYLERLAGELLEGKNK